MAAQAVGAAGGAATWAGRAAAAKVAATPGVKKGMEMASEFGKAFIPDGIVPSTKSGVVGASIANRAQLYDLVDNTSKFIHNNKLKEGKSKKKERNSGDKKKLR